MKTIVLTESLRSILNITERAISRNKTLPILNNILIKSTKTGLEISATDLELAITANVLAKTEKEWETTILAKTLSSFINNLSEPKTELEFKNNNLVITTQDTEVIIPCVSSKDFPIIPKTKTDKFIRIKADLLKNAVSQVINSADTGNLKPELSSVFISLNKEELRMASTDSFRLSEKIIHKNHYEVNIEIKEQVEVIIPLRCAQELLRVLSQLSGNEEIKILIDNNQIGFEAENFILISKLIEGSYPKYQSIIPNSFKTTIYFNKKAITEILRLAGNFSSKINDVLFEMDPVNKEAKVITKDPVQGEFKTKIKLKIEGEPASIRFNWKFLLEGLESVKGENIFWGLNNEVSPCLIKSETDNSFIFILMPIKI